MNLAQIRKQYPQYASVPDGQLAEGLRKKFYPQLDPNTFNQKIGFTPSGMDAALADARSNVMRNNAGTGAIGRTIRAAGQGATFGFGDELNGGVNYLTTALANATGHGRGYSAAQGAQAATQATREDMGQFHAAHPYVDTGAQIAGSLPGLAVGPGAVLAREGVAASAAAKAAAQAAGANRVMTAMKVARAVAPSSAKLGLLAGAAQGAGNAQGGLLDRAAGGVKGGAAGALTGAAVPFMASGAGLALSPVTSTVRSAGRAVNQVVQATTGKAILNPRLTALSRLSQTMAADRVTPDAMRQAQQDWIQTGTVNPNTLDLVAKSSPRGAQKTLALIRGAAMRDSGRGVIDDATTQAVRGMGSAASQRTAALTPGVTQTADQAAAPLDSQIAQYASGTPNRLLGDAQNALGITPSQARGGAEAVTAAGRQTAAPLYDQALGSDQPVINDQLMALAKRPTIKRAGRAAYDTMLDQGKDPTSVGIMRNDSLPPGTDPNSIIPIDDELHIRAPNAQTWDIIKKMTGNLVERDPMTGSVIRTGEVGVKNQGIDAASKDLTSALRDAIPGYGDALDAASDYLAPQQAYEAQSGALTSNRMPAEDVRRAFATYDPNQQAAGRSAFANDIFNLAENGRLNPDSFSTPAAQGKLGAAFSPDAAQQLATGATQERNLAQGAYQTGLEGDRAAYQTAQANRNAIDNGANVTNTRYLPQNLTDSINADVGAGANPQFARIGARDALQSMLGASKGNATGTLNAIESVPNLGGNLDAVFGPEASNSYRTDLGNIKSQVDHLRSVNPNVQSRTAMNLADDADAAPIKANLPRSIGEAVLSGVNKIRSMSTLTDPEREALTNLAASQNPADLDQLLANFARLSQGSGASGQLAAPTTLLATPTDRSNYQ